MIILIANHLKGHIAVGEESIDVEGPQHGNNISIEERLKSLGYLSYVVEERDPSKNGVTIHDRMRAYQGLNLYTPEDIGVVYLIDMDGNKVFEWKAKEGVPRNWRYAKIAENMSILVNIGLSEIARIDRDSSLVWITNQSGYHHDLTVAENGDIYAIRAIVRHIEGIGNILDENIVVMDENGDEKRAISLFDILGKRFVRDRIQVRKDNIDIFHVNSIGIIPREIGVARKGDVMICVRNMNLIVIVNTTDGRVMWRGGRYILERPHNPVILPNNNILVFDNGPFRGYSRVLSIDPRKRELVGEYNMKNESFFTANMGGNQRLPNGNTLITESDKGRAFEITSRGEIVWEFYVPERDDNGNRPVIYRMHRVRPSVIERV
ncbi:MAG: arylsulfotransferase family protein [Candidatus Altiarchaeota archaeon]